jgi:hypothetical protein
MKLAIALISITGVAINLVNAQNLLLNGNFNSQNVVISSSGGEQYGATPDDWTTWTYSPSNDGPWANRQEDNTYSYDGSFYMALGNDGGSGDASGVYQTVSGTAGDTYDLTVESGAQNWWWPEGEMRLWFLDASSDILNEAVLNVTTGISGYDTGLPWQSYNLSAIAPAGTTQVKVEFAADYNPSSGGGGTVFFDDAVLTAVPEPSTWAILGVGGIMLLGWRRILRRA